MSIHTTCVPWQNIIYEAFRDLIEPPPPSDRDNDSATFECLRLPYIASIICDAESERRKVEKETLFFEQSQQQQHCNYCGKDEGELKRCSRCKKSRYCSMTCQKKDWMNHKNICNDDTSSFSPDTFVFCNSTSKTSSSPSSLLSSSMLESFEYLKKKHKNMNEKELAHLYVEAMEEYGIDFSDDINSHAFFACNCVGPHSENFSSLSSENQEILSDILSFNLSEDSCVP